MKKINSFKIENQIKICPICSTKFKITGEWGDKGKKYCSLVCREEGNLAKYKKRLEERRYEKALRTTTK
jgi:hypothetical protein